jgi:hypothetical protein
MIRLVITTFPATFVQNFINKLNSVSGLKQPWVYLLGVEGKQTSFDSIFYLLLSSFIDIDQYVEAGCESFEDQQGVITYLLYEKPKPMRVFVNPSYYALGVYLCP